MTKLREIVATIDADFKHIMSNGYTEGEALRIMTIAQVAHEINKAFCEAFGDTSQTEWILAPDWQRQSAFKGVLLHLTNPNAGPSDSHDSWLAQKVADGWVFGPVKDPEAKTHPCIVPYDELPPEQKAKDFLFRQTVHSLKDIIRIPHKSNTAE